MDKLITEKNSKHLHSRVTVEAVAIRREGGCVARQVVGQVVTVLHRVDLIMTWPGRVDSLADQDLQKRLANRLSAKEDEDGHVFLVVQSIHTPPSSLLASCCVGAADEKEATETRAASTLGNCMAAIVTWTRYKGELLSAAVATQEVISTDINVQESVYPSASGPNFVCKGTSNVCQHGAGKLLPRNEMLFQTMLHPSLLYTCPVDRPTDPVRYFQPFPFHVSIQRAA